MIIDQFDKLVRAELNGRSRVQDCIREWHSAMRARGLPVSPDYSLSATFGDPLRIRDWQLAGLPADQCVFT